MENELYKIKEYWSKSWDIEEENKRRDHVADMRLLIQKIEELQQEVWMLESALDASHGIICDLKTL